MGFNTYEFSGKTAYLTKKSRVFKDGEAPVWTMRIYPKTAADRAAIRATGVKNKAMEDDGSVSGVEGWFFTFRARQEYPIVHPDGRPVEEMIGNGSDITMTLEVETFKSPTHGDQARSEIKKVVVNNLIVYVPPTENQDTAAKAEVPAE